MKNITERTKELAQAIEEKLQHEIADVEVWSSVSEGFVSEWIFITTTALSERQAAELIIYINSKKRQDVWVCISEKSKFTIQTIVRIDIGKVSNEAAIAIEIETRESRKEIVRAKSKREAEFKSRVDEIIEQMEIKTLERSNQFC